MEVNGLSLLSLIVHQRHHHIVKCTGRKNTNKKKETTKTLKGKLGAKKKNQTSTIGTVK